MLKKYMKNFVLNYIRKNYGDTLYELNKYFMENFNHNNDDIINILAIVLEDYHTSMLSFRDTSELEELFMLLKLYRKLCELDPYENGEIIKCIATIYDEDIDKDDDIPIIVYAKFKKALRDRILELLRENIEDLWA